MARDRKKQTEYMKQWRAKNPDKHKANYDRYRSKPKSKELKRNAHLKRNYNMSLDDMMKLLRIQKYKCAICSCAILSQSEDRLRRAYVDHCHSTGEVRGLLCHCCNTALGYFKDNVSVLLRAIKYLKG